MPIEQVVQTVIFVVLTAITLGGALGVVTSRNLFHGALYLVLSLAGVVGYYVMLNAGFLAAVQLLIYIGAIAILCTTLGLDTCHETPNPCMHPAPLPCARDTGDSHLSWISGVTEVRVAFPYRVQLQY